MLNLSNTSTELGLNLYTIRKNDKTCSRYENGKHGMSLKYNTHRRSHNIMNVKCHMNLKRDV